MEHNGWDHALKVTADGAGLVGLPVGLDHLRLDRLVRIIRGGRGPVVTWRRAQVALL